MIQTKLSSANAILDPGDPDHKHREEVRTIDGRLIGTCQCGFRKDYTVLHDQIKAMQDGNIMATFNLNNFVKEAKGDLVRVRERQHPRKNIRPG